MALLEIKKSDIVARRDPWKMTSKRDGKLYSFSKLKDIENYPLWGNELQVLFMDKENM